MSSVVIAGDTSGTVTLAAPAVSGTTTLTLPATTGTVLTSGTAVTVAQGGTGLTAVGSSGNLLTSNGTTWVSSAPSGGVTSLNGQTGAITNTGSGDIGSYTIAYGEYNTAYAIGSTIAGSSLAYRAGGSNYGGLGNTSGAGGTVDVAINGQHDGLRGSYGLSGTWRSMTVGGANAPTSSRMQNHVWVRVS